MNPMLGKLPPNGRDDEANRSRIHPTNDDARLEFRGGRRVRIAVVRNARANADYFGSSIFLI